jgi:hypothetical protein
MESTTPAECPFCMDRMQVEDRDGHDWLICPNGCPTEIEAPLEASVPPSRAAGS